MIDQIMKYNSSRLLDPEGVTIWEGLHADRLEALQKNESLLGESYNVIAKLCGAKMRKDDQPWVRPQEVTKAAEELDFISHDGCAPGFFVLLPAHTHLDRVTQAFNKNYLDSLNAQEIEFPLIYDNRSPGMEDLSQTYEAQNRVFRLDENDKNLRLSYAADPSLLSWLRSRTLLSGRMPYTIVSPVLAMRRHPSGELGPYNKSRQYKLPDVHMLSTQEQAASNLLNLVELNSKSAEFWVGNHYAQFLDATPEFLDNNPGLPEKMAQRAGTFTLLNTLAEQPRYYAMRSGVMVDSGMGAVMLYNIQWDEQNPQRFNIKMEDQTYPVIIHGNALAGSGLLNTLLGRSLAGVSPKIIPPEIALSPVILIPLKDAFTEAAQAQADRLTAQGMKTSIMPVKKSLGKTLWELRDKWQGAFAVIGDKEKDASHLTLQQGREADPIEESKFILRHIERMNRCRASYVSERMPLPFNG